jgi:hypothetical protein
MGRRRKRLIVQADLTSEEDHAFLAWVLERRRRRRLAEEIRHGLQLQYQMRTNRPGAPLPAEPDQQIASPFTIERPATGASGTPDAQAKLARLVGGF